MPHRALAMLLALLSISFPCPRLFAQEKKPKGKAAQQQELPAPSKKIAYKKVGDKEFNLHIFVPESDKKGIQRPCIVFFFGGGWASGDPKQFYSQCRTLADLGMVAISAEYRVSSRDNSKVIESVADAQDAFAFVRANAQQLEIDPNKIAAGGGSAGGHLAATLATLAYRGSVPERRAKDYLPNALVLFNPAVVLAPTHGANDAELETLTKNLRDRLGDEATKVSPYHQMTKQLPPTIIFHGKADVTVPYWSVEAFQKKATSLGSTCQLVGYEGEAHGFFNLGKPNYQPVREEMIRFLKQQNWIASNSQESPK